MLFVAKEDFMNYCPYCMEQMAQDQNFCTHCGKSKNYVAPAHHLLPGTLLRDRYMVGAALGEGGFGITYIGRDINLDMLVAIKEYFPSGFVSRSNKISPTIDNPTTTDRKEFFEKGCEKFLQEARILAKFSGRPGIVDVRDFFDQNNTAYIVMEYLKGETLKEILHRNGTMPYNKVLQMLMPVFESLKEVHKKGLIHRDISPDNIMLVDIGAKLLDFGAARDVASMDNKSVSVILKPGYAPEEQYRTRGAQGPWTDIYALCATMYKCITGITPDDSIERNYSDTLKPPSHLAIAITPVFEAALMKGLAISHTNRYQTIDELLAGFNGKDAGSEKTVLLDNGSENTVAIGLGKATVNQQRTAAAAPPRYNQAQPQQARYNPTQQQAPKPQPQPQPQPRQRPMYAQPQQQQAYRPQQPVYTQPQPSYVPPQTAYTAPEPKTTVKPASVIFADAPAPVNFGGGKIWAPMVLMVLSVIVAVLNDSYQVSIYYDRTSTTVIPYLIITFALCIFSAVAMQTKQELLCKIARWADFAFIAATPLLYGFWLDGLFRWNTEGIVFATMLIIFTFSAVGTYYKRLTAQRFAIPRLKSNLQTISLAAILFIDFAYASALTFDAAAERIFENGPYLICSFLIVFPILSLAQAEKRIPNVVWVIAKVLSILAVIFTGLNFIYEHFVVLALDLSTIDYFITDFTGIEHLLRYLIYIAFSMLFVVAVILCIDISHSNIFRKVKK